MITTYDFILTAKRDNAFMAQLKSALSTTSDVEICTATHKLTFHADKQTVTISAASTSTVSQRKLIPKEIKYQALLNMLDGKWNDIGPEDITDI